MSLIRFQFIHKSSKENGDVYCHPFCVKIETQMSPVIALFGLQISVHKDIQKLLEGFYEHLSCFYFWFSLYCI